MVVPAVMVMVFRMTMMQRISAPYDGVTVSVEDFFCCLFLLAVLYYIVPQTPDFLFHY